MDTILVVISVAVLCIVIGYFIGRARGGSDAQKKREYELRLEEAQENMDAYRQQVTEHFKTTAELMHEMTDKYKSVYTHLASGAQQLTHGRAQLTVDTPAERLITAQSERSSPANQAVLGTTVASHAKTGAATAKQERSSVDASEQGHEAGPVAAKKEAQSDRAAAARQAGL